ncbi:MAG TPA: Ig-like domain-containing protein, partial [Candidatus Dormibacteraeota bacterium]|nr:Ig-like domain-containing protein [Candidatus Dormibacteraeota bacterium]
MSINSVGDITDGNGHGTHTGPIFPATGADGKWGDIIPPFTYGDKSYPGMNWTAEGQDIYEDGCAIVNDEKANVAVITTVFNATTNAAWAGTEQAGASAYDTSRVVAPSAMPVPTGTVTYTFYTNDECAGDGSSAGTKTLTATGTVPISDTKSPLAKGSYAFKATYSGDTKYNSKVSDCEPFTVTEAPPPSKTNV